MHAMADEDPLVCITEMGGGPLAVMSQMAWWP